MDEGIDEGRGFLPMQDPPRALNGLFAAREVFKERDAAEKR
jgi:hypothetical protein